jgi:hypothetical protein
MSSFPAQEGALALWTRTLPETNYLFNLVESPLAIIAMWTKNKNLTCNRTLKSQIQLID